MRIAAVVLLLTVALSSAGCGWQVRGWATGAMSDITQIRYETRISSSLKQLLDREFLTGTRGEHSYRVIILQEMRDEQAQTLTARLHTGIERLEKQISYRIESADQSRSEQGIISAWRDIEVVDNNPAATDVEKRDVETAINRELLAQLLRHLHRFASDPEA